MQLLHIKYLQLILIPHLLKPRLLSPQEILVLLYQLPQMLTFRFPRPSLLHNILLPFGLKLFPQSYRDILLHCLSFSLRQSLQLLDVDSLGVDDGLEDLLVPVGGRGEGVRMAQRVEVLGCS